MRIALVFTIPFRQGFPPRGILYISSYIKKYDPEIECDCYDCIPAEPVDWSRYNCVGISCMTAHYQYADRFARRIKEEYHVKIVIGGIHFSLVRKMPVWADFGMIGEGEKTSLEFYQLLKKKPFPSCEELSQIDGLVFRKSDNEIVFNKERQLIPDLDDIPFPDYSAIDMTHYLQTNNTFGTRVGRGLSLLTSRGCAFNCDFCTANAMWKYPRYHSAEYVVDEIEYLQREYGIDMLYITDDNFCSNVSRLKRIADLMEQRKIKIEMGASGRVEYYNDEIRDCYRRIGIKALSFGFETGSDRMLRLIKNGQRLKVEESVAMSNRIAADGIEVQGLFMLNMPGETEKDLDQTLEMIKKLNLAKIGITIATPFYGTAWWDIAVKQGIVPPEPDDSFWDTYDLQEWQEGRPLFKTEISEKKLKESYEWLMKYRKQLFFFDWKNRRNN